MNYEVFAEEVRLIGSQNIKQLVWKCLENAPDYFWGIPSSSTGKYHPKDDKASEACRVNESTSNRPLLLLCRLYSAIPMFRGVACRSGRSGKG